MIPHQKAKCNPFSFFDPPGEACEDQTPPGSANGSAPKPPFEGQSESIPPPINPAPPIDVQIDQHLNLIPPKCPLDELETHIRPLTEMLVLSKASTIVQNGAQKKLNKKLKSLQIDTLNKSDWDRLLREAALTVAINNPEQQPPSNSAAVEILVSDLLVGCPVPPELVVPSGYKLLIDGVYRTGKGEDVRILSAPVVILARMVNDLDNVEDTRLAWLRDGKWVEHVCSRATIMNKNKILDLAANGLTVNSGNNDDVVAYLVAFEAANVERLPRDLVRRQLGWVDDTHSAFLWGDEVLTGSTFDPASKVEIDAPSASGVLFRGADAGDQQVAAGFRALGSLKEWRTIVGPALQFPRAKFVLLAGLAAPLVSVMAPWGAKNFVVDVCGETSKGKTTTLRLAASAWGNPDEDSGFSAVTSWNSTVVGGERRASILNGIPLLKDDTKKVKDKPWLVSQSIYDFSSGRGRDRGTVHGLAATTTFKSTMILTGESRATSMSGDGGTRARVLTLWGLPFEFDDNATCQLVLALGEGIKQHYGYAGPRLVEFIMAHRHEWNIWGGLYKSFRDEFIAASEDNSVVARLADALALIALTGAIAAEALGMPELAIDAVYPLLSLIKAEAQDADRATQALWTAWDYACSHPDEFFPNGLNKTSVWTGHWQNRHSDWAFLGFVPEALKKLLTAAGFDYDQTLLTWRDRGWLLFDESDRSKLHHQAVLDGGKPRLIAVKRKALQEVGCDKDAANANDRLRKAAMTFVLLAQEVATDPDLRTAADMIAKWAASGTATNGTAAGGTAASGTVTADVPPTPASETAPFLRDGCHPGSAQSPAGHGAGLSGTAASTPADAATTP